MGEQCSTGPIEFPTGWSINYEEKIKIAQKAAEYVNFSKAFIGIDGFSPETGFTSKDMLKAETASAIVKKSRQTFVLTDSTKFDKIALSKICNASEIDCLITDEIPEEDKEYLKKNKVEVILL